MATKRIIVKNNNLKEILMENKENYVDTDKFLEDSNKVLSNDKVYLKTVEFLMNRLSDIITSYKSLEEAEDDYVIVNIRDKFDQLCILYTLKLGLINDSKVSLNDIDTSPRDEIVEILLDLINGKKLV